MVTFRTSVLCIILKMMKAVENVEKGIDIFTVRINGREGGKYSDNLNNDCKQRGGML